jgi:hypothetical protein
MPKRKSIKGSANEFKTETDKILAFLTASAGLGDEHVSWCHDLAIIRLYRAFESLMLDALVGALNNDTSTLSTRTGFSFPKHLTDEVCRFLVTGRGYFDFKGRDVLIKALQAVPRLNVKSTTFKVKDRDKGKPEHEGPLHAYRELVHSRQRDGLYWMPCAAPDFAAA